MLSKLDYRYSGISVNILLSLTVGILPYEPVLLRQGAVHDSDGSHLLHVQAEGEPAGRRAEVRLLREVLQGCAGRPGTLERGNRWR